MSGLIILGQSTGVINADPPEKFYPLRTHFQGHSRSLELAETEQLHVTSSIVCFKISQT